MGVGTIFETKDKNLEKLKEYERMIEQGLLVKEEDVLKFYYCESEDKYLVGQRGAEDVESLVGVWVIDQKPQSYYHYLYRNT